MPDALSFNLDFNAGSDPIDTTVPRQAHANTFRRLLRLWEKRTHFSLILAVVDHTDYRDALIRQLDAQRQGSHVMLGAEDAASEWLRQAQDACASGSQPLQVCLPLDAPRSDGWWQQVNLLRERLADAAPLPQIVWLSNTDVDQAAHHAPDLWNWREAVLELNIGLRRTTAMGEEAGRLAEYPADRDAPPSPERLRQIEAFLARQTTDSESDTILTAGLRLEAATEYLQQGHPGRSQVEATRAAQLFHEYGDVLRAAHALQIKAKALVLQGQLAQAIEVMTTQVIPVVETSDDRRLMASTLTSLAEMLVFRGQAGDAEQALRYFQRSLLVSEGLLRANPDSAQAARDVSISLDRLADFLSTRGQAGDAEQALRYFQHSLQVREDLLRANPDSAQAARDVSVSLNKLADFLSARGQAGDAEQALRYFLRSLQVREDLLRANSDSAQAARDVSVSLNKLADFLSVRGQAGDAEQALRYFQRSLQVREDLLRANPDSAQAARDVSVSLNKLADFLSARAQAGDVEQALLYFQRSLQVREDLLRANPDSAQAARDLAISLERLAGMASQSDGPADRKRGLAQQLRAVEIYRGLVARQGESYFFVRTLAVGLYMGARYADQLGRLGEVQELLRELVALLVDWQQRGGTLDPEMAGLLGQLTGGAA